MKILVDCTRRLAPSSTVIVLLLSAVAVGIVAAVPPAHGASAPAGIAIPLYSYPTSGTWSTVIQAREAYPNVPFIAIISPASGPGSAEDYNYAQGIKNLQAAGIKVLGYVDTAYGADSLSWVEYNIGLYNSWYHVNGIFFDEMNNVPGYESYYSTLSGYVHSLGMATTMGNPGTSVPSSYIGTMDILNVYENYGYPSLSFITYTGYSPSNFAFTAYGVGLVSSYLASAANSVAWEYVTDGTWPNPYNILPSYFMSEVASLSSIDGSLSATAAVTVESVSQSGSAINGMWTTWSRSGSLLASGFTPTSFGGTVGDTYTVTVSNYGSAVFCHWQDGTTNPSKSLVLQGSVTLKAYYSTTSSCQVTFPVNIVSETTGGVAISGLYTTVGHNGVTIATGYTPLAFTAASANTYAITVDSYGIYGFSHWSTGSTSPSITITPYQATTLVAYYNVY